MGSFERPPLSELIEAFLVDGPEVLHRADGQFLAATAASDGTVSLCRDRTGVLPLTYASGPRGLAVSAWPLSAMQLAGVARNVEGAPDLRQIPLYRVIIDTTTLDPGVMRLPSKCAIRVKAGSVEFDELRMPAPQTQPFKTLAEASDILGGRLSEAVRKRLAGSRCPAAWLSGGNDSSLVVALAREHHQGSLKTVFVTFEDYNHSYGALAREVAARFGTDHTECTLDARESANLWAKTIHAVQGPAQQSQHGRASRGDEDDGRDR